jgi:hypothetical protein
LIIVVGLAFEARIAAGPGIYVICGGNGRNLRAMLTAAIAEARMLFGDCPGVGAAHGLPVAAMRVITDPAERAVPASAVAAMRPNGTANIGAMIGSALMRPREIPALFQTALDALAARATLVRGRRLLGPGLWLVNSLEGDPATANEPYLGPAILTATMEGG